MEALVMLQVRQGDVSEAVIDLKTISQLDFGKINDTNSENNKWYMCELDILIGFTTLESLKKV